MTDLMKSESIDAAEQLLVHYVRQAQVRVDPSKGRKKPWFDRECKERRKALTSALQKARRFGECFRLEYCLCRKSYYWYVRRRKKDYLEEQHLKILTRAKSKPYILLRRSHKRTQCTAKAEQVAAHFQSLFYEADMPPPSAQIQLPLTFDEWLMNVPWTTQEVEAIVKTLPTKKSCGLDGIYYEHWRDGATALSPLICSLFNKILERGHIPNAWHKTRLSLLFKGSGGDPKDDMNLFRGIASE